jgi:hypothetical protein
MREDEIAIVNRLVACDDLRVVRRGDVLDREKKRADQRPSTMALNLVQRLDGYLR